MSIDRLDIYHVRSIISARLNLHPRLNIFYGPNASGKTSLLESVYLLCHGHSFRTRELAPLLSSSHPSLMVFARIDNGDELSIQKSKEGTLVRVNQRPCSRSSELASFLPCQVFYQGVFDIIDAGPSVRRSLLDWGLFHVKHEYHGLWKDYRRVLNQRNALLRQKADISAFHSWDNQLVELSEALNVLREDYCHAWFLRVEELLRALTTTPSCLTYEKGWDKKRTGKTLRTILREQFEMDRHRQYTHSGAHQADIDFKHNALKVKHVFSRGQQKILLIALKLAQSQLLSRPCLYLFDDVASEIDIKHLERIFSLVEKMEGQFFFTCIDPTVFSFFGGKGDASFFSIDEGRFVSTSSE